MKQMNTDEVYNRTMINTTWVKKAGGGTCNVPSTEEAHEVKRLICNLYDHGRNRDKRITALEETVEVETKDSYDHYADSFGEVEQRLNYLETLHYRGKYPARHNYSDSIEIIAFENCPVHCDSCRDPITEGYKLFVGKPYVPLYLCLECVECCEMECKEALRDE